MPEPRLTERDIALAIAELFEPELRRSFVTSIETITDDVILRQLIEHIQNGDFLQAFDLLAIDDGSMRPLTSSVESIFERGGVMTGRTFPKYLQTTNGRAVFRFNVRNSRAERFIREQAASLVTNIAEDTRINVRRAIERGVREGRNPRNVALDLVGRYDQKAGHRVGGVVGLTVDQAGWVQSARRRLTDLDPKYFDMKLRDRRFDGIVRKAIAEGKPLKQADIDRLVTRYTDGALRHRGEMIARNEATKLMRASEWEAYKQAQENGSIGGKGVRKKWDTTEDGRERPSHGQMDGQSVDLDQPFVTPGGDMLMYPGDASMGARVKEIILCRCRPRYEVDWITGVR